MAIFHCLWVGALVGSVASRFFRNRGAAAPLVSGATVGILGALIGGLVVALAGSRAASLPRADLLAAGLGAVVALTVWALLRRAVGDHSQPEKAGPG